MAYAKESKAQRKQRLVDSGKWKDFLKTRNEIIGRFKGQGLPEEEAKSAGDKEADSLYTPYGVQALTREIKKEEARRRNSDPKTQPEDITRVVEAGIEAQNAGPDHFSAEREIRWVHQNLMVAWSKIDLTSVPSGGAVAILEESKKDFRWFYEKFYAKLIVSKTKDEGSDEGDDEDKDPAEIDNMIADLLTPGQMEAASQ